ncbi:FAD-dependent oxidoreductase [Chitinispirillales bacterium ANBcel5]|uniref:oxidoreductase n=1 Tax=Cellulosispirillum alkaliphilum TaxID=3039283 RepID=UPI002A526D14|nr:FAD-dependent oxidoreductase [Chitinispirillales bacterium ANBcel5]
MQNFPTLLSPGQIGSLKLKNKVVMAPMGTLLCGPGGELTDHFIKYYEERAAGGTGLIIVEVACVEPELGKAVATQARIDDNRFISGLSRLAGAVQKYGSRVFVQLHHAGNQSNSQITGGKQIVAPSTVTNAAVGEEPRELSTEEVKGLVEKFVSAAERAQTAGLDGVELHGAHGYLICEFLSPHTNRRTDEYGGNFENRMRFVNEIIAGIKQRCGNDFPVCVRFSADEFTGRGIDLKQGTEIAQALESAGADALHVSCGTYESLHTVIEPIMYHEGWKVYLAEAVKEVVKIPVITVGAIKLPSTAENILESKRADFVAVGRALLCDSQWVNKASEGKEDEIIPCIGCMHCTDTIFSSRRIQCAVDARTGRELEFDHSPQDGNGRVVSIIGGGPAGMEAARVLANRHFRPIVYEQEQQMGGELNPGCTPPDKKPIRQYRDALIRNTECMEIALRTGTEATPDLVRGDNPYAVIVAVGGKPIIPQDISGIDSERVVSALEVLNNPDMIESGSKAVVVGGGMTGCETAELLESRGIDVSVVEMLPEIAVEESNISKVAMIEKMKNSKIELLTGHKLIAVHDRQLELQRTDGEGGTKISADYIIISLGLENKETQPWTEAFERCIVVGDALKPSNVAFAIRTAFDAAFTLR